MIDEDDSHAALYGDDEDDRQTELERRRTTTRPGRSEREDDGPRELALRCQSCKAPYVLSGELAISLRAQSNRYLARTGQAPIDDLCERCYAQDRVRQAREADGRRAAANRAAQRLAGSIRPSAVEADDWRLVTAELGDLEATRIRCARNKPKAGAM